MPVSTSKYDAYIAIHNSIKLPSSKLISGANKCLDSYIGVDIKYDFSSKNLQNQLESIIPIDNLSSCILYHYRIIGFSIVDTTYQKARFKVLEVKQQLITLYKSFIYDPDINNYINKFNTFVEQAKVFDFLFNVEHELIYFLEKYEELCKLKETNVNKNLFNYMKKAKNSIIAANNNFENIDDIIKQIINGK